jgi:hypothetical protein
MPAWGMDLLALFELQLGAFYRSLSVAREKSALWAQRYPVQYWLSLLPIFGYLLHLISLLRLIASSRGAATWLAYFLPFLAAFLFFLWNAIQISPLSDVCANGTV